MPAHRFGATQTLARCDKDLLHLALFAIFVIVAHAAAVTLVPVATSVVAKNAKNTTKRGVKRCTTHRSHMRPTDLLSSQYLSPT